MAILKGRDIKAQDITDAINGAYPEWLVTSAPPNPGERFLSGVNAESCALAFVSIGGLPIRMGTTTIGGHPYTANPDVDNPSGFVEGFEFFELPNDFVEAPNVWTLLQATSTLGTSDIDTKLAVQMAALSFRVLATMQTLYTASGMGYDAFGGERRVAGKA